MNDKRIKTLKEFIDDLDTKYYIDKNKDIETEIFNIMMGRPRYEGISYRSDGEIVPTNKKKTEIRKLRIKQKIVKKKMRDLDGVLKQLNVLTDKLEKSAEEDFLLRIFGNALRMRDLYESSNTEIYKSSQKKYDKLYLKSVKKIEKSARAISADTYRVIKSNLKHTMYHRDSNIMFSLEGVLAMDNMDLGLKDKKISVRHLGPWRKVSKDFIDSYKGYISKAESLGVDVRRLQEANSKMEEAKPGISSLTPIGQFALERIRRIDIATQNGIAIHGGRDRLHTLKTKYEELIALSRETWYLEQVLTVFANTSVVKTEMYRELTEMAKEQEVELYKMETHINKMYDKTDLEKKIELKERLDWLYDRADTLKSEADANRKEGNIGRAETIEEKYYHLKYEMLAILKEYPDLNHARYGIDINKFIRKEVEEFAVSTRVPQTATKENTPKPKQIDVNVAAKPTTYNVESSELRQKLYQNYMNEKVFNHKIRTMSFGEYLEMVVPHLTDLVKEEKEREQLSRTIYKEYLKYYSSLANKYDALPFSKFAANVYGVKNIKVPLEYEESYNNLSKSLSR